MRFSPLTEEETARHSSRACRGEASITSWYATFTQKEATDCGISARLPTLRVALLVNSPKVHDGISLIYPLNQGHLTIANASFWL